MGTTGKVILGILGLAVLATGGYFLYTKILAKPSKQTIDAIIDQMAKSDSYDAKAIVALRDRLNKLSKADAEKLLPLVSKPERDWTASEKSEALRILSITGNIGS